MIKSKLKPFSDFDSNIAKEITRNISSKKKKEIEGELLDEFNNWNILFKQYAYIQASLTRRINKGLDSLNIKELNKLDKERKSIIEAKEAFKKSRELVRKKIKNIVNNDIIRVRSYRDFDYKKSEILSNKKSGVRILFRIIGYIKRDINTLESEADKLQLLINQKKISILKIVYQKYLLALNMYKGDKEFNEEIICKEDVYEDLIEYMEDNSIKKYPLMYYATPNFIDII